MFGSSARPVKARTPKQSLQEYLASLKPQPRFAAFGHQPTEAMMGRARERILKRRGLNDRSSTNALPDPITIKIDILREVSSPDFQKEWLASEIALAQDNLAKLKNKVATILAYHARERSKDKLMSKRPSSNVHERSRQLYCAELTDNYTWQPVDVSVLNEIARKMTDEFPHPDALASELARGNRPEQRGNSLFEQATKALRALASFFYPHRR
jgi:hypothetical protein